LKRPRYLIAFILFSAIIATSIFYADFDVQSIGNEDVYELSRNESGPAIEDGKLNLTSGGYLKIKNIDQFIDGDFMIRFVMEYMAKRGFSIRLTGCNAPGSFFIVKRDNIHFKNKDVYNFVIRRTDNRFYLLANGLIQTVWEERPESLGDLVVDVRASDASLDSLEIIHLTSTGAKTTWQDSFFRYSFLCPDLFLNLIKIILLFSFLYAIESKLLCAKLDVSLQRQKISLLASMGICAIIALLAVFLSDFSWLNKIIIYLFIYFRVRFWLVNSKVLLIKEDHGKRKIYILSIFLLLSMIALFWVFSSAFQGRANLHNSIFAGVASVLIFWLLTPFLFIRMCKRDDIWNGYSIFTQSSFMLALIGLVVLIFPNSEEALTFISFMFPMAVLTFYLPVRANYNKIAGYNCIMIFIAILFFVSVEAAMRISPYQARFKAMNIGNSFDRDDLLFWVPKGFFPHGGDFPDRDDMTVKIINFRSGAVPVQKPKDLFRIMVIGGSNVYGDGVDNPKDVFPSIIEKLANRSYHGKRIEVINCGVPGYNSFQLNILYQYYASNYDPDLLICYLGRNDVASGVGIYTFRETWLAGHSPKGKAAKALQKRFASLSIYNGLTQVIINIRNKSLPKEITDKMLKPVLPPGDLKENIREIVKVARKKGTKVLIATEYWGEPIIAEDEFHIMNEYYAGLKEIAQRMDVPFLDTYSILEKKYNVFDIVFREDVVHLNHKGHRELAKILYHFLVEIKLIPVDSPP